MINYSGYLGERKKVGHCWLHPRQYNVEFGTIVGHEGEKFISSPVTNQACIHHVYN